MRLTKDLKHSGQVKTAVSAELNAKNFFVLLVLDNT
jgi:hypothetical protein